MLICWWFLCGLKEFFAKKLNKKTKGRSKSKQAVAAGSMHVHSWKKKKHACEGRAQSHKYNHAEKKEHGAAQKSLQHLKLKNEPEC